MLYHRFTIISLFLLGASLLSIALLDDGHLNRTAQPSLYGEHLTSHALLQTDTSRLIEAASKQSAPKGEKVR